MTRHGAITTLVPPWFAWCAMLRRAHTASTLMVAGPTRSAPCPETGYEVKFARLLQMIAEAKAKGADTVIIHHPEVLGDIYAELIESLNRIAAAQLHLMILPPDQRGTPAK